MKKARITILIGMAFALALTMTSTVVAQNPEPGAAVPKYDRTVESTFKGTVEEVKDRLCPVSGGMGSHLILKLSNGSTIEAHLASTKFVKTYDLLLKKGDAVEVVGTKVQFEGVETIFAREVIRQDSTFSFRDKSGTPLW